MTIPCSAYGMNIPREQCRRGREWFYLERICGGCQREQGHTTPMAMEMEAPERDPAPQDVVTPGAPRHTISGVRRTGPTIETGLRRPMIIFATTNEAAKINMGLRGAMSVVNRSTQIEENRQLNRQKEEKPSTKPRRRLPPGMSKAVARSLGLV